MKFFKALLTMTLTTFAFVGLAQAQGDDLVFKVKMPNVIKHDMVVEPQHQRGTEVNMDDFKKIAKGWFVSKVHLHAGRLCQRNRMSTANNVPIEYLLTYTVTKSDVLYTTVVDMSKEIKPITEKWHGSRDHFAGATCHIKDGMVQIVFERRP